MAIDYAARARALVGTRFRPQGRGEGGLDCVGVVLATFDLPRNTVRADYRLRGDHLQEMREHLGRYFRSVPKAQGRSGDVMLLAPGAGQAHLAVCTPQGFVHAHAGLKRVVETPGEPDCEVLGIYRKRRSC
jgi:hypothetical protein